MGAVTRREGEEYDDFVRRAGRKPVARVVKRADLEENLDITRLESSSEDDRRRVSKYQRALTMLDDLDRDS